jgi:hypothetical protein
MDKWLEYNVYYVIFMLLLWKCSFTVHNCVISLCFNRERREGDKGIKGIKERRKRVEGRRYERNDSSLNICSFFSRN